MMRALTVAMLAGASAASDEAVAVAKTRVEAVFGGSNLIVVSHPDRRTAIGLSVAVG